MKSINKDVALLYMSSKTRRDYIVKCKEKSQLTGCMAEFALKEGFHMFMYVSAVDKVLFYGNQKVFIVCFSTKTYMLWYSLEVL